MRQPWVLGLAVVLACGRGGAALPGGSDAGADRVFVNGRVLTMDGRRPEAEALAVRGGNIVAIGSRAEVERLVGASTTVTDLGGRTLMPGFIAGCARIAEEVRRWNAPSLRPAPTGSVRSVADIQRTLSKYLAGIRPAPRAVVAFGYDPESLKEKRAPTRAELDQVSMDVAIVIVHASGQFAVANSAAVARVGYARATRDPAGGVIHRDRRTHEPTGLLEGRAINPVLELAPPPSVTEQLRALDEVQEWYASYGITTVRDEPGTPADLDLLREAAREHRLVLDVASTNPGAGVDGESSRARRECPSGSAGSPVIQSQGALQPGKRADLVVLAANPRLAKAGAGPDADVVETIKDGRTIFTIAEGRRRGPGG